MGISRGSTSVAFDFLGWDGSEELRLRDLDLMIRFEFGDDDL